MEIAEACDVGASYFTNIAPGMGADHYFVYAVFGTVAVIVVVLLLIGRFYPGSGAEVLDWQPTRSLELETELELNDIDQMLEAQNERRRLRGAPERSLEDVELEVAHQLREQQARKAAGDCPEDSQGAQPWPGF